MRGRLIIVGAGGHGRVVADIARATERYSEIVFLDDAEPAAPGVVGKTCEYKHMMTHTDTEFVIAIGNNSVRERLMNEMCESGATFAVLVHPMTAIGSNVEIGEGSVVMAGAVINSGARIGRGAIVNTCSSVDHDCNVGDFTHISIGAHVAGTVNIGKRCFVCAGATVINNIRICEDCTIAAGAAVIHSIESPGLWAGVPAVRKK